MKIEAYDLATRVGLAFGPGGEAPRSLSFTLKSRLKNDDEATTYDHLFEKCAALERWLFSRWRFAAERPDLVGVEHPIAMQRGTVGDDGPGGRQKKFLGGVQPGVILPWMLAATTCSLASALNIPVVREWPGSVTKHFVGGGKLPKGDRKPAILDRCHLLGYLPKDCRDTDRSDACALWDLLQAKYGRRIPKELVMFGERDE